jgi:hypothetical protein
MIPTKPLAVPSLAQSDTLDLAVAHTRFSSWMSHKPRSVRRRRDAGAATDPHSLSLSGCKEASGLRLARRLEWTISKRAARDAPHARFRQAKR